LRVNQEKNGLGCILLREGQQYLLNCPICFGSNDAHHPTEYVEQQWSSEEWSLGCPCLYTPPGVLTKVGEYLTEPHGHVHFVGTETAVEWKGYMEGALTSGIRGADEVVKLLRDVVA
jgi:monoamine oxidase